METLVQTLTSEERFALLRLRRPAVRVTVLSWLWLLPPLTLTTAFVIFGAWRRAVRDAEVEAVDEDGE